MKLTRLSLVLATFVLLHNAGGWGDPEEEARLLAPRVNVYPIKHQLLGIGLPAVRPLFDQVASKTPVVAFEARSALRWIAYDVRFSAAKTEALLRVASEKLTSKEPSLRQYAAELIGFIGHADSASPKDSAAKLAPLLSDPDAGVRSTAILSLEKIPGPSATHTLAKALPAASAETKVALLRSLGRRRDPKALKVLQSATKDASEPVRLAAIGALGMAANTAGLSALEAVTRSGSALEKEKALASMLGIANGMDPRKQAKQAESLCLKVLQSTGDEETRVEGLRVLSRYAGQDSVGLVSGLMKGASPRAQMEAVNTLRATSGKSAEEALLAVVASDNPDLRYAAIEALGERGDRSAVPVLVSAAGDTNERVRCAAVEALGRLGDDAGLEAIASAWEKGPGKVKQASVTACLEIANSLLAKGDKTKANAVFQQVEGRATTESDRIAAIDGIGRSGLADSLGKLEPLMKGKSAIGDAAIGASASIADSLATSGKKEEAVQVYLKCLDLSSGALSEALMGRLKELGVAFSSPRGFITYWWVAGPFLGEGRAAWNESYFPEKEIDLKKEYVAGQTKIKWQGGSTDSEGVLDLAGLLTPNENAAAYCFVELKVEKEQDVYLKAGSDDGIRIWLNGALIHDKLVDRGLTVDEDRVEAHLRAGANRLLLKVTNGGGGYNVCLRITERTNRPLKFKIKTEAD